MLLMSSQTLARSVFRQAKKDAALDGDLLLVQANAFGHISLRNAARARLAHWIDAVCFLHGGGSCELWAMLGHLTPTELEAWLQEWCRCHNDPCSLLRNDESRG